MQQRAKRDEADRGLRRQRHHQIRRLTRNSWLQLGVPDTEGNRLAANESSEPTASTPASPPPPTRSLSPKHGSANGTRVEHRKSIFCTK